ncbi:MAG: hypothetical protein M3N13_03420 [Candidatus Eremiobacteraeota bacterium]|nr:hypothetical protein [Candidatus Eremiobacteraeota bacterium]
MNIVGSATIALAAVIVTGAPSPVTRYILSYTGPASAWEITSGPRRPAPKNGLPLLIADCIVLHPERVSRGKSATLTVIVDGREISVDRRHPRLCVREEKARNPVVLAIARSFRSLRGIFHQSDEDYENHSTATVNSRGLIGPQFAMPLLDGNDQYLGAGTRALSLAWLGGTARYTVTVTRAGRPARVARARTVVPRVRLDAVRFIPGIYHVTVTDAKGVPITQRFTVVPVSALPRASRDIATILADEHTPVGLRAAYDAARLMAEPSHTWRFEAYQRLSDRGQGSALAVRLRYELETGD